MELIAYFLLITLISVGSFWITGSLYGLIRSPSIYFPLSLAAKMAITAVLGGLMLMIGGVVLSTLVFNAEMKKRDDYQRWSTLACGALISVLCSGIIYFAIIGLAWEILG